jgi:hypothetical protein
MHHFLPGVTILKDAKNHNQREEIFEAWLEKNILQGR